MQCPKCRGTRLRISVVFAGEVSCEFRNGGAFELLEDAALESFWDESSVCECPACRWTGVVREAEPKRRPEVRAPEFAGFRDDDTKEFVSDNELSKMQHELGSGRLTSARARDLLHRLTVEVSHLRNLVSILEDRFRRQMRQAKPLNDAAISQGDSSLSLGDTAAIISPSPTLGH